MCYNRITDKKGVLDLMKGKRKKFVIAVIIAAFAVFSVGCDFIVKETPVEVENAYSRNVNGESTDSDSEADTDSSNSDEKDTTSKNSSDKDNTGSDKKSDTDKNSSSSKAASPNAAQSKAESKTESKAASSKASVSSRAPSNAATSSGSSVSSKANETEVSSISLDIHEITLDIGQTKMPIVTMFPKTALDKSEVWTSSDEKVATVTSSGTIRAVGEGKCVVTVTSGSNSKVSSKVSVTVTGKPKVEKISLDFNEKTIAVGETVMPRVTMTPLDADTLAEEWTSSDESIATVDKDGIITAHAKGECEIKVTSVSNKDVIETVKITVTDNKEKEGEKEPVTEETYIQGVLVVNKTYGLPESYAPGGLTSECREAFNELKAAAAEDGITIYISSGYRSYQEQKALHQSYVDSVGEAAADVFSARAGYSEHQTGLAIDCNEVSDSFIGTPEAQWLAQHCYEYGFIIRYPQGKESITGYKYEPWHIRYVGEELAKELNDSGLTIEEYLGITSSY